MSIKTYLQGLVISFCTVGLFSCSEKKEAAGETNFTKVDSLTETYLALQDSMLQSWNSMVNDDNVKITAMHDLVHELMVSAKSDNEDLVALEQRLEQLTSLRYSPKTMANEDVVVEYDFASASLITEMITIAESQPEFGGDSSLQKLVEQITAADQRVNNFRKEYDLIAAEYNRFIEENQPYLKEIDKNSSFDKKPLFQMAMDE